MKSAGLAVVLSFFISGLGQIYNGQIAKGLAFIVAYGISWLLTFVVIGWLPLLIFWIWGMMDAHKSAERINAASARPA